MRLCLTCGYVDEHRDCALVPAPKTSPEKVQRVQKALGELDRLLFTLKMSKEPATRTSLLALLAAEGQLERFQAKDLADFGQKRAYNLLETALKDRRKEVEATLGDASHSLGETFAFAKKAIELLFRVAGARLDATSFDASPLGALPIHPVEAARNKGISLARICQDVDARLEETRSLDAKVRGWSLKNLSALVGGGDPLEFPAELVSGGLGMLGAIVGRGPASKRASASTQFKLLGDSFRERLYLLAANPIVLRRSSGVSQSEEAWRKHLAGAGAARWEEIRKAQQDVLAFFLGPIPEVGARIDESLLELAKRPRSGAPPGLVPFDTLGSEDWETLARAYFLIYDAVVADASSNEGIVWDRVVRGLIERKPGGAVDSAARAKVVHEVKEEWVKRPPGETAKGARP